MDTIEGELDDEKSDRMAKEIAMNSLENILKEKDQALSHASIHLDTITCEHHSSTQQLVQRWTSAVNDATLLSDKVIGNEMMHLLTHVLIQYVASFGT